MDDGCSPYLILVVILSVLCVILLLLLIYLIKKNKQQKLTEEELKSLVNEGHESGVLLSSEATMIQNIFEFGDTDVKDIMVHRKNMVALDSSMTLGEAVSFMNEKRFSRYPVFEEDLDHIIGIFHIKDAMVLYADGNHDQPLSMLRDNFSVAEFVPETHGIDTLFNKMRAKKMHMVVVVDEYGQVSGIISMEDILEEIVGNIFDEHDEEEPVIEQIAEETFSMEGRTTIEEAESTLGVKLSEDFETVSGYIVSLLGKVPEDGSSFIVEDDSFTFEVLGVSGKVIDDVIVRPKSPITDIE